MPRVELRPGGRSFEVAGAESILEAALGAGLALPYGCSSGTCGECKARVVSGTLERIRHHDYAFTAAEKLQGYALLCCNTARSDLVVEAAVAHDAADIAHQRIAARVRRLEPLGGGLLLLELGTARNERLRFLAGQDAVVSIGAASATLPIASCPCEERRLQFHLRRDTGDALSALAFEGLRVGEAATVEGPVGEFTLREDGERPLTFVAWGWRGFAPVKSVIEHALSLEAAPAIDLAWIARDPAEHYQPKLCRAWADAMDAFRYRPVLAAGAPWDALDQGLARLDPLPGRDFYVAGSAGEVAATRAWLVERKVPAMQVVSWSPR